MISEKNRLQKEIHEEEIRRAELVNQGKPAPTGGETCPLFQDEHYWKDGDYKIAPDELIPRHVSSDNIEDLYKYIDTLSKEGNKEASEFLSKQAKRILRSGKTFEFQGNLASWEKVGNTVGKSLAEKRHGKKLMSNG